MLQSQALPLTNSNAHHSSCSAGASCYKLLRRAEWSNLHFGTSEVHQSQNIFAVKPISETAGSECCRLAEPREPTRKDSLLCNNISPNSAWRCLALVKGARSVCSKQAQQSRANNHVPTYSSDVQRFRRNCFFWARQYTSSCGSSELCCANAFVIVLVQYR